jgi:hypothetical protein
MKSKIKDTCSKPNESKQSKKGSNKCFNIDKKKPERSRSNWKQRENIQLIVCSFMHFEHKQRWKDLFAFIKTKSVKQIQNKFRLDNQVYRCISDSLAIHSLIADEVNANNREEVFNKLYEIVVPYINECAKNINISKVFGNGLCSFSLTVDDIDKYSIPYSLCSFFDNTESLTIELSNEDYKIFQTLKCWEGIPVLDHSNFVDFLVKKQETI